MGRVDPNSQATRDLKIAMANAIKADEIRTVLGVYLGDVTYGDVEVAPGGTIRQMVEYCFQLTANDGSLDDFVGRVIHLKWGMQPARKDMLALAPSFVRPPALFDFTGAVGRLATGLASLGGLLAGGKLAEQAIEPIQDNKAKVAELAVLLRQLEACKGMHDALHVLQVKGAEWLDMSDDETPPLALFSAEVRRVVDAGRRLETVLPDILGEKAKEVVDTLDRAAGRLALAASPADENAGLAREMVRAVLIEEAPRFNEAILRICWDLPIRSLRTVLAAFPGDASPPVLRDLADALRCSVMAHGLWQEIDADIYEIEHLLLIPPPDFIVRFADHMQGIVRKIRWLSDDDGDAIFDLLRSARAALTTLEKALPDNGRVDTGPAADARELLADTMAEFAAAARLRFYAVDSRLKAECAALLAMRQPLDDLHTNLPAFLI